MPVIRAIVLHSAKFKLVSRSINVARHHGHSQYYIIYVMV